MSFLREALADPVFALVGEAADQLNIPAFVVGGYVRDFLLGHGSKDVDIVAIGSGVKLAQAFAEKIGSKPAVVYENFGTALVRYKGYDIEFIGARKESYRADSRKPLVENGSLEDDQKRRDFTINALYLCLNQDRFGELLDPFGGIGDMQSKILRTPLDPDITFSDDPLRMMRAARFAARLDYLIDEPTFHSIARNKERIRIVSMERITEELNKLILTNHTTKGFMILFKTGLLEIIFPELQRLNGVKIINGKGHKDNFFHTLKVLENLCEESEDLWLRWSALLHDIAKPATAAFDPVHGWSFHGHEDKGARLVPKIFTRMKLPLNDKMKFVQKMVRLHLRPIALVDSEVSDAAIRRLIVESGEDLEDLLKLCRADITTRDEERKGRYRENFNKVAQRVREVEERDQLRNWQPPITGEMIMAHFNIPASALVGKIKNAIREAILEGEIPNELEAARAFMIQTGEKFISAEGGSQHEK
jgi:tRNA nucleotidyltransferase/poly(A) polymerase